MLAGFVICLRLFSRVFHVFFSCLPPYICIKSMYFIELYSFLLYRCANCSYRRKASRIVPHRSSRSSSSLSLAPSYLSLGSFCCTSLVLLQHIYIFNNQFFPEHPYTARTLALARSNNFLGHSNIARLLILFPPAPEHL